MENENLEVFVNNSYVGPLSELQIINMPPSDISLSFKKILDVNLSEPKKLRSIEICNKKGERIFFIDLSSFPNYPKIDLYRESCSFSLHCNIDKALK